MKWIGIGAGRAWSNRVKQDGVTLWFALKHPRTPWWVKAMAAFVVAYALSPIDLIPDFIPVLGYLDDAILLPGLIWLAVRMLPADVRSDSRLQAQQWMARRGRKPRVMWGVVGVVLFWIAVGAGLWLWIGNGSTCSLNP